MVDGVERFSEIQENAARIEVIINWFFEIICNFCYCLFSKMSLPKPELAFVDKLVLINIISELFINKLFKYLWKWRKWWNWAVVFWNKAVPSFVNRGYFRYFQDVRDYSLREGLVKYGSQSLAYMVIPKFYTFCWYANSWFVNI